MNNQTWNTVEVVEIEATVWSSGWQVVWTVSCSIIIKEKEEQEKEEEA